jgi:hypothetical protein
VLTLADAADVEIGALAEITRQNFANSNVDFNFSGVELTGTTS